MNLGVFDIENFNILSDDDNYYFFRALNMGDNNDIETGITLDSNGEIYRIRTDRERYDKIPIYNSDSSISLMEMVDHIKMQHRTDTNCISLTSNANAAALYGRGYYKDKYVMVKVPKKEIGSRVYNAGQYMINEIKKVIDNYLENNEIDDMTKYFLSSIRHAKSEEKLDEIMKIYNQKSEEKRQEMFEKGIIYQNTNTTSVDYQALNAKQNFEKNKIVAILNVFNKNIIPNVSNKLLIQTLGNAFSSLELINYKDIEKEYIIDVPKEMVDILALLQQVPENYPLINELKDEIKSIIVNKEYSVEEFKYANEKLDTDNQYTIENMYNLTNGNVDFYSSINLYTKSFYLAKSKLRTLSSVDMLSLLVDNNKYGNILSYLRYHTYGVEPEVFSRQSSNRMKISESVSLDFSPTERELFDFIDKLSTNDLDYIINNPTEALKYYLENFDDIEHRQVDKETYYANAIVDLFNWSKLNVVSFSNRQRNQIVDRLKESNIVEIYNALKERGVREKDIANTLLTTIIKDKTFDDIDLNDTFTVEELEDFLGYYRINNTKGLKLRSYQASALTNIDDAFRERQFTTAVLPTGAGKSFVALAEMLEHSDEDILYLAPNDEILNQIERYILEIICEESIQKSDRERIKEKFKHLKLCTYQSLLSDKRNEVLNGFEQKTVHHKYGLIIFDELHRSGASEWKNSVLELLEHQDEKTKVLGITATPRRDMDNKDMADEWAEYFGYTKEEIIKHKHLAINMDLEEAIRLGYVMNPKIVQCEYSLEKDGSLERLRERIESIEDENLRTKELAKFEVLRRKVSEADGIEKVIGDNIKQGGKYIVFCPVTNDSGKIVETEDGYSQNNRVSSKEVIEKYQKELILDIIKYRGITDANLKESDDIKKYMRVADKLGLQFNSLLGVYGNAKNRYELEQFERDEPDKIKFITVINKLNEGAHVNGVNGLIWLRPLDENSKILYLQQLGRIIFSVDPNKEISGEDRTVAIDVANNVFRVNMDKEHKDEISDLDKLVIINSWVEQHNGRIPDLNSFDRIESSYGLTLKRIQNNYSKYLNDSELLDSLSEGERLKITEIIRICTDMSLWTIDFPERAQKNNEGHLHLIDGFDYDKFEITGILKDYYDLTTEVNSIDNSNWEKMYSIAKMYYEQYGDLDVARSCRVIEERGKIIVLKKEDLKYNAAIRLGDWLRNQRQAKKGHGARSWDNDKEKKLNQIGMIWEKNEQSWNEMYDIAKKYYEQYGDLDVARSCRVIEERGKIIVLKKEDLKYNAAIRLGEWLNSQRRAKKGHGTCSWDNEREEKLNQIEMIWDKSGPSWNEMYDIAKKYYEQYGDLDVTISCRVIEERGKIIVLKKEDLKYNAAIRLGEWLNSQRRAKKGHGTCSWDNEREEKLNQIEMIWDKSGPSWNEMYDIAKKYYEQYGNLDVTQYCRVIEESGKIIVLKKEDLRYRDVIRLGEWLNTQRKAKKGSGDSWNEEKEEKLNQIGMIWDKNEQLWNEMYNVAKKYYEQYGDLDVAKSCRVIEESGKIIVLKKEDLRYRDVIRLGEWLNTQRKAKKGSGDSWNEEKEEKLNQIGMIWEPKEHKFITKTITPSNSDKLKKELDKRLDDLLEQMKEDKQTIGTEEDVKNINNAFADSLGKKR